MTRELPTVTPPELVSACKCVPIDAYWPIQSPLHALELLLEWDKVTGVADSTEIEDHIYRITHSHAHEDIDRKRLGIERLYDESIYVKYVSIAWHLAGRYEYDNELIAELDANRSAKSLLDFGAAPWIQAIFYANCGLDVTVVNKSVTSDTNLFGRWLADRNLYADAYEIKNFASDDPEWGEKKHDIIYAVDVLEHIPPLTDGTPGWIPYAEKLYSALKPGGIWYLNAPLDFDPGVPRPVIHHPVHYTSPLSVEDWIAEHNMVKEGHFLCRKSTEAQYDEPKLDIWQDIVAKKSK